MAFIRRTRGNVSDDGCLIPCILCVHAAVHGERTFQAIRCRRSTESEGSDALARAVQIEGSPGLQHFAESRDWRLRLDCLRVLPTRRTTASASLVNVRAEMWMYLALAFSVLIAFNVLIVLVGHVVARLANPREELDATHRARILTYLR